MNPASTFPVDLEVCTLALRLGNATGTGGREPEIGGGGSEVALPVDSMIRRIRIINFPHFTSSASTFNATSDVRLEFVSWVRGSVGVLDPTLLPKVSQAVPHALRLPEGHPLHPDLLEKHDVLVVVD